MKIEIWYRYHHDDYGADVVESSEPSLDMFAFDIMESGSIMINGGFVPWHCISHMRVAD